MSEAQESDQGPAMESANNPEEVERVLGNVESKDRLTLWTEFGEILDEYVHSDGSDTGHIHMGDPSKESSFLVKLNDMTVRENGEVYCGHQVEKCIRWPQER